MSNYKLLENLAFVRFIKDYSIEEGTCKVPNFIIYHEYKKVWKGLRERDKINRTHFFRLFHHYFKSKYKERSVRGFMLNEGSFDLSIDNITRARVFDRYSLTAGTLRGIVRKRYLIGENEKRKRAYEIMNTIKRELQIDEKEKQESPDKTPGT